MIRIKRFNESLTKPSHLLDGELYKDITDSTDGSIPNLMFDEIDSYEMDKIILFIKKFISKFDSNIINHIIRNGNKSMEFLLENGSIWIHKLVDDYFYIIIEMPFVIKGYEKYCDHRSEWKEFVTDSIDGLEKFVNEDPLKIFYPHIYQSVK